MMKLFIYFFGILVLLASCGTESNKEQIINPNDYNRYLDTSNTAAFDEAVNEVEFWSKRLRPDSSGVGDLGPLAGAYTSLFYATGDPSYLGDAEALYRKAIEISANNKDIYARGLARTFISQHRFKEAEQVLKQSYEGISSKRATEYMLFDILMELGNYEEAETYLKKLKNTSDYNYLIRKAKWSDHVGDLTGAINYLESAKAIAESRDSKSLRIWTYSNLADFYGHDGRIIDAYQHYIKTLELQPDNAYAKKGIAWIAYAYEGDTAEARRILDSVMVNHKLPDYYLFLAEMAEHEGEYESTENFTNKFVELAGSKAYGDMYNSYLIEIWAETRPEEALRLAETEVNNRATPETYSILAYANLKAKEKVKALQIIDAQVKNKTFEPMAIYYTAEVYKANGKKQEVEALKKELEEAAYELGPVLSEKIDRL